MTFGVFLWGGFWFWCGSAAGLSVARCWLSVGSVVPVVAAGCVWVMFLFVSVSSQAMFAIVMNRFGIFVCANMF